MSTDRRKIDRDDLKWFTGPDAKPPIFSTAIGDDVVVSTHFEGIAMSVFGPDILTFATIIVGGPHDLEQRRYSFADRGGERDRIDRLARLKQMHAEAVKYAKSEPNEWADYFEDRRAGADRP